MQSREYVKKWLKLNEHYLLFLFYNSHFVDIITLHKVAVFQPIPELFVNRQIMPTYRCPLLQRQI